jgi:hypothetical protein
MTERIILSVVTVIMFLLTLRQQGLFVKLIVGGLTIGVLLTWTANPTIITIGFLLFTICSLLTTIYGLTQKHLTSLEKVIISLTGFIVMTGNIFAFQNWPYAIVIGMVMIIPVIGFIILLFQTKIKFKQWTGLMTILAVNSLINFIKYWT